MDDDTVLTAQQIKALQRRNAELEEENLILKKSHCNLHATRRQRRKAIQALSGQHRISILCRVLDVNRSTYYKFINRQTSRRQQENVEIKRKILEIYAKSNKRLGAGKVRISLARDDCISIREGRVYRLMKEMNLPKMSTVKPSRSRNTEQESGACTNLLAQQFSRDTLRDAVKLRASCSTQTEVLSSPLPIFGRKWIASTWFNPSPQRGIHTITLLWRAFSSI